MAGYVKYFFHYKVSEKCDLLLTTDQCEEIRTYDTTTWRLLTTINHPHRQFQHLTPIKATWHPHADVIVAGRYPKEKGEQRCVDVLYADGHRITSLDSSSDKIQSVVRFSPDGKFLLSSFACGIEVWGTRKNKFCS
ncbi:hypothetical protein M8J75_008663 [Diaphorina citri]|nr:hypothetical protein M8J75_008663 [Diaphorina citri]